jgi:hypothetical protein
MPMRLPWGYKGTLSFAWQYKVYSKQYQAKLVIIVCGPHPPYCL